MKAREFAKRAMIYGLGLTLYVYELFVATVEGLGLNTRGFWGESPREPMRSDPPGPNVAAAPPYTIANEAFEAEVEHLTRLGVRNPRDVAEQWYGPQPKKAETQS
jgi:hypothetical protein